MTCVDSFTINVVLVYLLLLYVLVIVCRLNLRFCGVLTEYVGRQFTCNFTINESITVDLLQAELTELKVFVYIIKYS